MEAGVAFEASLLVLLLLFSAFFSSSEAAFLSVQRLRVRQLIDKGVPGARRVAEMVENLEHLLPTILVGNNLVNTAAAALGTAIAIRILRSENQAILASTIAVTILLLVFAEVLPKTIAVRHAEQLSLAYALPLKLLGRLLSPSTWLLQRLNRSVMALLGTPSRDLVTEEEIKTMITVGHEAGAVEKREAELLSNVFRFGDRLVREVMTPRPEIVWLEKGFTMAHFLPIFSQRYHSRFPVYEGTPDNVVGVLYIKDVLRAQASGHFDLDRPLDDLLRPAYFVPETKRVGELFEEMQNRGYPLAIVVDEYGGTAGLVTLRQLAAEIVGQAGDELEKAEKEFEAIDEHTVQVDGGMHIDQANEELLLNLPEGEYETVAGLLLHLLGRIPRQGEQVRYNQLKLVVTEMRGVRIEKILVTKG